MAHQVLWGMTLHDHTLSARTQRNDVGDTDLLSTYVVTVDPLPSPSLHNN